MRYRSTLVAATAALASLGSGPWTAVTAQAAALPSAGAAAAQSRSTLSGTYSVAFQAQGNVPDQDPGVGAAPTGSTFSTEGFTYTASISGLPLQKPFFGSSASYDNPANTNVSRYVKVSDVTFHYDDPQSDTVGCNTLESIQKDGVPTVVDDGQTQYAAIAPHSGLDFQGTLINVPVTVVGWPASPIESPPGCVTNTGDIDFNVEGHNDSVQTTRDRHTVVKSVNIGQWGIGDINGVGGNGVGDPISQLFLHGPTVRCASAVPQSYATSGSCTITNNEPHAGATLSASIHWSFKASNVPYFTDRIVSGNHQTAKRRHAFREPLGIKVAQENGKPVPNGVGVFCKRGKGARVTFVGPSSAITEHGRIAIELKAGKRAGKLDINCTADGVKKPLRFQLRIT